MKIKITRDLFLKAWKDAAPIASQKTPISALQNVKLSISDNGAIITASDLKTTISMPCPGVESDMPGAILLPVKTFGDMVKQMTNPEFTLDMKASKCIIKTERSKMQFATEPEDNWPNILHHKIEDGAEFVASIPAHGLTNAILRGMICAGTAGDFPKYLGCALLQVNGNRLTVASTDGKRLGVCHLDVDEAPLDLEALLPHNGLKSILATFSGMNSEVSIYKGNNCILFESEGVILSIRIVESQFPNYERLLKNTHESLLTVDKTEIKDAIARCDIIASQHNGVLKLKLHSNDIMTIVSRAPDLGTSAEEVSVVYDGPFIDVGVYSGYLQGGINSVEGAKVTIKFNGSDGQIQFDDGNFTYMMMPSRLSEYELQEE